VPVHGLDGALLAVRDEHAWVGDVVLWHGQRVGRQVRLAVGLCASVCRPEAYLS
jgi:hypothetical protein